jgi:hypothetical protein
VNCSYSASSRVCPTESWLTRRAFPWDLSCPADRGPVTRSGLRRTTSRNSQACQQVHVLVTRRRTRYSREPGILESAKRLRECVEASAIPAALPLSHNVKGNGHRMMKRAAVILIALGMVGQVGAHAFLARFEGGIGVDPVASFAAPLNNDGTFQNVLRNFVRGVRSSTAIWRISDLKADVDTDGRIKVTGRGLLLGGTDSIGTNANQSVFATLICETVAPFTEHNTADTTNGINFIGGVPLEPNGDFRIDDTLRAANGDPLPSACASPVLLIRSAGNGAWFAAGIPRVRDDR